MSGEICQQKEALWVRLLCMVFNGWRYIPSFLQDFIYTALRRMYVWGWVMELVLVELHSS